VLWRKKDDDTTKNGKNPVLKIAKCEYNCILKNAKEIKNNAAAE